MRTIRFVGLYCLALLALLSTIAPAQESKPKPKPAPDKPAAEAEGFDSNPSLVTGFGQQVHEQPSKIEQALQQQAKLDFVDTPLRDVVTFLQEVHGIPIVLNRQALEEANIPVDTPVTKNIRGIRLETTLTLLLRELGLVFDATDEFLEITTPKDLATHPQVRVYDCRDLLGMNKVELPAGNPSSYVSGDVPSDAESLKQTITRTIDASSWNTANGGGTIENFKGLLIVSHNGQTQRQIERLLNTLRETAGLAPRQGKSIR